MATIATEVNQAALNGITALIADIRFDTSADAELAVLPLSWGSASNAAPSVATATATADTITKFIMRTAGAVARISGSVGTSATDLVVTDNVIPSGATASVYLCPGEE